MVGQVMSERALLQQLFDWQDMNVDAYRRKYGVPVNDEVAAQADYDALMAAVAAALALPEPRADGLLKCRLCGSVMASGELKCSVCLPDEAP